MSWKELHSFDWKIEEKEVKGKVSKNVDNNRSTNVRSFSSSWIEKGISQITDPKTQARLRLYPNPSPMPKPMSTTNNRLRWFCTQIHSPSPNPIPPPHPAPILTPTSKHEEVFMEENRFSLFRSSKLVCFGLEDDIAMGGRAWWRWGGRGWVVEVDVFQTHFWYGRKFSFQLVSLRVLNTVYEGRWMRPALWRRGWVLTREGEDGPYRTASH